jgi:molybdate transport system substrate-binding protein
VGQLPVPEAFNVIAHYPIAMVTKAARPKLAREFMAFVISPAGQEILHRHGFAPADAATHPSP